MDYNIITLNDYIKLLETIEIEKRIQKSLEEFEKLTEGLLNEKNNK